jgi:hypothetical protein
MLSFCVERERLEPRNWQNCILPVALRANMLYFEI